MSLISKYVVINPDTFEPMLRFTAELPLSPLETNFSDGGAERATILCKDMLLQLATMPFTQAVPTEVSNSPEVVSDTITLSKDEYDELVRNQTFLTYLEGAGVDNWDGYEFAAEAFREDYPDED